MWLQRDSGCDGSGLRLKQIPHHAVSSPERPIHVVKRIGRVKALQATDSGEEGAGRAPRTRVRADSSWIRADAELQQPPLQDDAERRRAQNHEKVMRWQLRNSQPLQRSDNVAEGLHRVGQQQQQQQHPPESSCSRPRSRSTGARPEAEAQRQRREADVDSQVWRNYRRVQQELKAPLRHIARRLQSAEAPQSPASQPEAAGSFARLQAEVRRLEQRLQRLDLREEEGRQQLERQLRDLHEENIATRHSQQKQQQQQQQQQQRRHNGDESCSSRAARKQLRRLRRQSREAFARDAESLERRCLGLRAGLDAFHRRLAASKELLRPADDADSADSR